MNKAMNNVQLEQVRRRIDGSLDVEFYRRLALRLRTEAIQCSLSQTWHMMRGWGAAVARLTWRAGPKTMRRHGVQMARVSKRKATTDNEHPS